MAFCLGPLRPGPARHEVLCLLRTDQERVEDQRVPDGRARGLAGAEPPLACTAPGRARDGKLGSLAPPLARTTAPALADAYERLARERLHAGLQVVGAGELLVTDRLHGHIVALLAGRAAAAARQLLRQAARLLGGLDPRGPDHAPRCGRLGERGQRGGHGGVLDRLELADVVAVDLDRERPVVDGFHAQSVEVGQALDLAVAEHAV